MSFEKNVKNSFRMAKEDITELKQAVQTLNDNQKWLIKKVIELQSKTSSKKLVASKDSNKVHADNCPFAKNIKANTKQDFESLKQAAIYGYEACECAI